jgi:hypothetical protein
MANIYANRSIRTVNELLEEEKENDIKGYIKTVYSRTLLKPRGHRDRLE